MTDLLVVRHADAGDPADWTGEDAARPLTDKGRRQAGRLARVLVASRVGPDAILSSPKVRAVETADILARILRIAVDVDARLAGPLTLEDLGAILADAGEPSRPIIIGHDPDLSDLCSQLTGTRLELRKGALARIALASAPSEGAGLLRWFVSPELLRH